MRNGRRKLAREFLENALASGPVPAVQIEAAALAAGISARTLRRARQEIGVQAVKAAFGGAWVWRLGPKEANPVKTANPDMAGNGRNGTGAGLRAPDGLTSLWRRPAHLAAVEAYWRAVSPELPPCLMWTFAREAESRYPESVSEQARWCIEQAIRAAFLEEARHPEGSERRTA